MMRTLDNNFLAQSNLTEATFPHARYSASSMEGLIASTFEW